MSGVIFQYNMNEIRKQSVYLRNATQRKEPDPNFKIGQIIRYY